MKRCSTCNSKNVYEIELQSSGIDDVGIVKLNIDIPAIDIMDLAHLLHAAYCNDCKKITHLTDD